MITISRPMRIASISLVVGLLVSLAFPATSQAAPLPKIFADPIVEIIFRQTNPGERLLSRVITYATKDPIRIYKPTHEHFQFMLRSLTKKEFGMLQEELARRLSMIKWEYDARVAGRVPRPSSWTEEYGLESLKKSVAAHFDHYFIYDVSAILKGKPIKFIESRQTAETYAGNRETFFRRFLKTEHLAKIDEDLKTIRLLLESKEDAQLVWSDSAYSFLARLAFNYNVGVIPNDLLPLLTIMPREFVVKGIQSARPPFNSEELEQAALDLIAQAKDEVAFRIARGPGPVQYLD